MIFNPNPFRLIQRIRHAYGFSVHSPFAFDLILDTILTPHSFYIYEDNRKEIEKAGLLKEAEFKYAELLFRLVNRFDSVNILEIGSDYGLNSLYISGHSKKASITCIEIDDEKLSISKKLLANKKRNIVFSKILPPAKNNYDAVIWDLEQYPLESKEILNTICNNVKQDGFIVVRHINKSKHNKRLWQKTCNMEGITMSFDLGAIGIGFFKPSLPKIEYDVYF